MILGESFITDIISIILDGTDPVYFVAYYFVGIWGIVLSKLTVIFQLRNDIKTSELTYWKASLLMVKKEIPRIVVSCLALPILILYSESILGAPMTVQLAIATGFGIDQAIEKLSSKVTKL